MTLGRWSMVLPAVAITGAGDQHLGFDLAEPVDYALGAEVRRRARPDGAQAGGGEHAHQRLPGVGHAGGDPIALGHAGGFQALLQAGDMGGEIGPGQLLFVAVFTDGYHRHGTVAAAQQVFGKIQRRPRKPAGAGHLRTFFEHRTRRLLEANLEEVDDGQPEGFALLDAPGVQGWVVVELQQVPFVDEPAKGVHSRLGDAFGAGLPEDVGHGLPLVLCIHKL